MNSEANPGAPLPVRTVLGEIPYGNLGITDAHNHVWISLVPGADPASPVLDRFSAILEELCIYRESGGASLLDCQPGGCGRNGQKLAALSMESGVNILACTGFHRRRYYSPDTWLFTATEYQIQRYLMQELSGCLEECREMECPPRAGFIKIALEAEWKNCPQAALEATAAAARETRALIEIHTEKGCLAERTVLFFADRGVSPFQLVLCHMDKRPDPVLHAELARIGALLEYDTFFRPKYEPETHLWPLIAAMVDAGHASSVALATDMAEAEMYTSIGGGPGLASLPTLIHKRLQQMSLPAESIRQMLGGNIARRLANIP